MIKGGGYGKLLKQLFIISLISCFGLLVDCFVNAGVVYPVGTYQPSSYDNNYQNQVIKKGSFLSQYLGTTKDVFIIDGQTFFLWDDSGNLYAHISELNNQGIYRIHEGFVDYYSSCDVFSGGVDSPTNCTAQAVDSSTPEIYKNFLSTVTIGDKFYYNLNRTWEYTSTPVGHAELCISSSSVNKSLCWGIGWTRNNYVMPSLGGQPLTVSNSQGLGVVSFGQLNGYPSPAVIQGQIEGGSSSIDINNSITGDIVYNYCSNSKALNWYEDNGYSNYLCYGGLDNFSTSTGVLPIAGQGLEFTDIRFELGGMREGGVEGSGMSDIEWFSYRRQLYDLHKKGVYSTNPFNNVPTVVLTYFGFVDVYGKQFDSKSILEYCLIKNNYNDEYMQRIYDGVNIRKICVNPILDYSNNAVDSYYNSGYGQPIGGDWSGILSGGSNSGNTFTNGTNYVQSFFNLLKSDYRKFDKGDIGLGFLPSYIILAFCGIILFRFLMH